MQRSFTSDMGLELSGRLPASRKTPNPFFGSFHRFKRTVDGKLPPLSNEARSELHHRDPELSITSIDCKGAALAARPEIFAVSSN
jgi:hypothetical protein